MNKTSYEQRFKAGLYVRLSREDEDKKDIHEFSESIKNQKEFLSQFAIKHGYSIVDIYADDGISGTTFDRNEFNRMIIDIENGKINMVITKDLSRLGRDYIKTGEYLEKYFPSKNIRYIAINDGYDSFKDENANNEMAPFKAVFNDMYAKDISKKVRTALKTKQLKGEYLGTTAPFGYKKDSEVKGKLIIDEESSQYIKKIFELFLSGKSINEIAYLLTALEIPTPSQYAKIANTQKYIKGVWNHKAVSFILQNEVYIGNMIQNKKRKVNYKLDKQVEIPKDKWIKIENTHQPIISKEDFKITQEMLKRRSYTHKKTRTHQVHLLSGLIFCGKCKAPMTFIPGYKKKKYYVCCSVAKRYRQELGVCERRLFDETEINNKILITLKEMTKEYVDKEKIRRQIKQESNSLQPNYNQELQKIQNKIDEIQKLNVNLYKDKIRGLITEKQFLEILQEAEEEKEKYIAQIQEINKQIEQSKNESNESIFKEIIEQTLNFENINRNMIGALIDKIIINPDGTMEINFKFHKQTFDKTKNIVYNT